MKNSGLNCHISEAVTGTQAKCTETRTNLILKNQPIEKLEGQLCSCKKIDDNWTEIKYFLFTHSSNFNRQTSFCFSLHLGSLDLINHSRATPKGKYIRNICSHLFNHSTRMFLDEQLVLQSNLSNIAMQMFNIAMTKLQRYEISATVFAVLCL